MKVLEADISQKMPFEVSFLRDKNNAFTVWLNVSTVPLTLNLTHACVCTRACTRLTRVKVNNLACIVSTAHEFGVRTNTRGTLDMHDINMPATCACFAI